MRWRRREETGRRKRREEDRRVGGVGEETRDKRKMEEGETRGWRRGARCWVPGAGAPVVGTRCGDWVPGAGGPVVGALYS